MQVEVVASIIAAATALAAVVLAPLLAERTAKRQLLGPMRQAWINDLRNTLSEYIAQLRINRWHALPFESEPPADKERKHDADMRHMREAPRLREKLLLLSNPKEHRKLAEMIEHAFSVYERADDAGPALIALRRHAQVVIKREWDVISKGKPSAGSESSSNLEQRDRPDD